MFFRVAFERPEIDIVAINDLVPIESNANLLKKKKRLSGGFLLKIIWARTVTLLL